MNAIARLCENLISKGRTEGMEERLNQLLVFGQIKIEEYGRLMGMLEVKAE